MSLHVFRVTVAVLCEYLIILVSRLTCGIRYRFDCSGVQVDTSRSLQGMIIHVSSFILDVLYNKFSGRCPDCTVNPGSIDGSVCNLSPDLCRY